METKIVEAKLARNTNAFIIGAFGLLLILLGMCQIYTGYLSALRCAFGRPYDFKEYFMDSLELFFSYWGNSGGYFVYLGSLIVIAFGVIFFMMRKGELVVYPSHVTGKASFGKQVELPINQISAISLGWFKGLTVATSAGSIRFWLIKNRDEVYSALSTLLSDAKNNNTKMNVSTADELRKYKELLDDGIITQEEFEAKKKQLLEL